MPASILASDVMDLSASLLNDTGKSTYTYAVQLPYLKTAYAELGEVLESNNVPMTNEQSAVFVITTTMSDIGGGTGPALPADLIDIQSCFERDGGSQQDFTEMTRLTYLPPLVNKTQSLIYFVWQQQIIKFLGATTLRDVRLNYIGAVLVPLVDQTSVISLFNAKTFLAYRTAALCSEYIGENPTRAGALNKDGQDGLDRVLNIATKGQQAIVTRRRPFMARYKVKGGY